MQRRWGIPGAVLVLVIAIALAGCGGGDSSTDSSSLKTSTPAQAAKRPEPKKVIPSEGPPPADLFTKDLLEGTGATAEKGSVVTAQFLGWLYKGEEVFVSSWSGQPITFTVGSGELRSGFEQGVTGMKAGGRREVLIPPKLAYGAEGLGAIPPNATLAYLIDLLSVS